MRIRDRIIFPSSLVALLLLVLGALAAWHILRLQHYNSATLNVDVSSIRAAEEMEIFVRDARNDLNQYLLTSDPIHLQEALETREILISRVSLARSLARSDEERAYLAVIAEGLDRVFVALERGLQTPEASLSTEEVRRLVDDEISSKVLLHAQKYLDKNEQELQSSNVSNMKLAKLLATAMLLLGTCGAIAGLVAGYGAASRINRSVLQLTVPIRDVAGKLNEIVGPVDVSADPSLADLESVMQSVAENVGSVVEQLHARHREIIRADQLAAVGQLAAGLAHELRNPLMCIKTIVQSTRRRGEFTRFDAGDLRILDEEITRLDKSLSAFLDFARPPHPEPRDLDLAHVVRQTVEFMDKKAQSREVAIHCRLPDEPLVVQADGTQLRQVLLNLLFNALDAVDQGSQVWVSAEAEENGADQEADLQRIRLRVADNGRGLPAQSRHRIYEPFFSTKETGLGLGLAISQRIIEAHGGELTADDREGGGAVFEVRLPRKSSSQVARI